MSRFSRFVGGMGDAYAGVQQGAADAASRAALEEDRAYVREQRARQRTLQDRQDAEFQRNENLRDSLANIQTTKGVDVNAANPATSAITVDDEGTPSATQLPAVKQVQRTQDEMLRDAANAFKSAGQLDRYLSLSSKADEIGMQRSAKLFEQVRSNAAGKTAFQIAQEASEVYNNDPMPAKVAGLKQLENGGVEVQFTDGNGKGVTKQFTDPKQILEVLESYYSPASYGALIKAKRDAAIKTEEELTKNPVTSVPGGYVDKRSRQFVQTVQPRGAGGAGAGGRGSKPPATPLSEARAILADSFEKGEVKAASPQQRADAEDFVDRVLQQNPGMPPARAAKIAVAASTNPASTSPAIDPKTGSIDLTYVDADGARYTLTPNFATAADYEKRGIKKEDMALTVKNMVGKQGDEAYQQLFVGAAFDPAARQRLIEQTKADANKVLQDALEKNAALPAPRAESEIRSAFDARLNQDIGAIERKLDLVKMFGEAPKPAPKPAAERRIQPAGGIPAAPPGSPQARWNERQAAARQKEADAQAAKAESAQLLSAQFQRDKGSMSPLELVTKYDRMRTQLSPADARDLFAIEREIR
ncbi:hypothetical protein [Piscinibacter gummiphilus]|uniref:Uncharacterized protein n=1 Tax=Piscinibacter gummiphilus TaxID=946333 RepID=A0ABZ0CN90_9BURK|nr:hypothetical protein [Piscinibacter gummiphilus]WOB06454.1 hypothetical protein RXV79_16150 [Piscinibacter gummiphilus]